MKVKKQGDIVLYEGTEYVITRVFNHGGDLVYYDLEAKEESIKGTGYRRIELSVYYTEIEEIAKKHE